MTILVDIQLATTHPCPSHKEIKKWIKAALKDRKSHGIIALRIVDEAEMTSLNHHYRKKEKPTNILSFACALPEQIRGDLLGDLVICAPVVAQEALTQNKSEISHWAHMLIHGTLHLLGFDHEEAAQAHEMESLETHILHELGFSDPYKVENTYD